ncbi:hypothetical protein HMN09_00504200 [Mycena chlorophos]|uniref:Nucleolar protein 9 n=1 Tax=Mycena chlorophos TaxID=658473 RepID=A0A8H6T7X2_MYCCL|nr:hypothetical protein HMN09_00504200 [Mycena chlorophos]
MPKELRKRGKKKKAQNAEPVEEHVPEPPQPAAGPSWIVQRTEDSEPAPTETPFGEVDVDVKAYFRTVDLQIRDWQEADPDVVDEGRDPNEERRMFFVAALKEMAGKEKQLATDPDCSIVLERMLYSMDDFVRRVFVDSLVGSYEVLSKNRFASHVCQTLFTVVSQTITREQRGILPSLPDSEDSGELRTLTDLVVDVCEELAPTITTLIMDPFASHVVRALLLLLSPSLAAKQGASQSTMRSKKSAKWKARQGPLKSMFNEPANAGDAISYTPPAAFVKAARSLVQAVRDGLNENETRALAADKVASPTLQVSLSTLASSKVSFSEKILLAVEAEQQMTDEDDSLMDRILVGLVSASRRKSSGALPSSDFVLTLLRDATSSHLLETVVTACPPRAFSALWSTYFKGTLAKIASHPVANFVLAKAIERLDAEQLADACDELGRVWANMIQTARTGVLRAAIDRAATLKACGSEVTEALWKAIQATTSDEKILLVPCMLRLQTVQDYNSSPKDTKHNKDNDQHEPKVQGAVLLQSLLRLPEPFNQLVIDRLAPQSLPPSPVHANNTTHSPSLSALPIEETLALATHPISSRVLDALLDSPTVPQKSKRTFVLSLLGHYHTLVDDRIGSRVGDRCWAFSDTYLKEKIARSLIPQESFLAGSFYGKFFARNLNLYLLQRRPDEWRTMQANKSKPAALAPPPTTPTLPEKPADATPLPTKKRKRDREKEGPKDEIDELFAGTLGKKVKRAALASEATPETAKGDFELAGVLGAIKAAPGEGKGKRRAR